MDEPSDEQGDGVSAGAVGVGAGGDGSRTSQSPVDLLLDEIKTKAKERARCEAEHSARLAPLISARDALWACSTIGELIPADQQKTSWTDQQAFLHSPEFAHRWIEKWKHAIHAVRELEAAEFSPIESNLTIEPRDGIAADLRARVVCVRDLFLELLSGGDAEEERIEQELTRLINGDRGSFSAHAWYFKAVAHEFETVRKREQQSRSAPTAQPALDGPARVTAVDTTLGPTEWIGPIFTTHFEEPPAVRKHMLTVRMDLGTGVKPVHHRIHGKTQAQLAHMVIEMPDHEHQWEDLLNVGVARSAWGPIKTETLRRAGRSIEAKLPPQLKGYWHQGMYGVRWQTK